jgi:hypothetical protein
MVSEAAFVHLEQEAKAVDELDWRQKVLFAANHE